MSSIPTKVPRKILIVTERFFPEEFIVNELAQELAKGSQITVLTQNPSYPFDRLFADYGNPLVSIRRWKGIRVVRGLTILGYKRNLILKMLNYIWFAFCQSILALFVAPGHERIFVFHTGPLTLATPAAIAARVYGIPMTVWTQDVWPDSVFAYGFSRKRGLEYILAEFVRWIYRRASTVLVSCEGFRESVRRYAPRSSVIFAPNWSSYTPVMAGRPAAPTSRDGVFMFAGNIGKVQNLEIIIRAFSRLEKMHPSTRLEIVGDGSNLQQLKRLAVDFGCSRVVFHGRVPVESMGQYYEQADFLVISLIKRPIFALTVPSKFQSYLAAGKPMLAAMEGEVARIVSERQLGYTAGPDQEDEIVAAMQNLLGLNPEKRQEIRQRSWQLLESDYSKEKVLETIKTALNLRRNGVDRS